MGEGAFCNRKQELSDLLRAMKNGEKFFVYSERRMGKTSLLKLALGQLPSTQFLGAYVDLWPTDGEASFAAAMAKAIAGSMARSADNMLETAKRLFSTLVPSVTLDEEGKLQLTFGTQRLGKGSPNAKTGQMSQMSTSSKMCLNQTRRPLCYIVLMPPRCHGRELVDMASEFSHGKSTDPRHPRGGRNELGHSPG